MWDLKRFSRWLRWAGLGLFGLAGLALLIGLGRVGFDHGTYVACRVTMKLGDHSWLEVLGLPLRAQAAAFLLLWGIPALVMLGAGVRLFGHLESAEPFRPGLSQPLRLMAWSLMAWFVVALLLRSSHAHLFPLFSLRWLLLLRPLLFLLAAAACFLVARLADAACQLRAEQDLVI